MLVQYLYLIALCPQIQPICLLSTCTVPGRLMRDEPIIGNYSTDWLLID